MALVPWGQLDLKRKEFSTDFSPIDPNCTCVACRNHTRAGLHSLAVQKETVACCLLTIHNVAYQVTCVLYVLYTVLVVQSVHVRLLYMYAIV